MAGTVDVKLIDGYTTDVDAVISYVGNTLPYFGPMVTLYELAVGCQGAATVPR